MLRNILFPWKIFQEVWLKKLIVTATIIISRLLQQNSKKKKQKHKTEKSLIVALVILNSIPVYSTADREQVGSRQKSPTSYWVFAADHHFECSYFYITVPMERSNANAASTQLANRILRIASKLQQTRWKIHRKTRGSESGTRDLITYLAWFALEIEVQIKSGHMKSDTDQYQSQYRNCNPMSIHSTRFSQSIDCGIGLLAMKITPGRIWFHRQSRAGRRLKRKKHDNWQNGHYVKYIITTVWWKLNYNETISTVTYLVCIILQNEIKDENEKKASDVEPSSFS